MSSQESANAQATAVAIEENYIREEPFYAATGEELALFESAYSLEVHLFRRMFSQIALLAVPGLMLAAVLTAGLSMWLLPWEWSLAAALVFGALVSATDLKVEDLTDRAKVEAAIQTLEEYVHGKRQGELFATIEEDEEQMRWELKEAFRIYDKHGEIISVFSDNRLKD